MELALARVDSLDEVESDAWNALAGDIPFLRHEFLVALEHSGAIGPDTSWQPSYLTLTDPATKRLTAALLLYVKYDSFGEFVFDWSWAGAIEEAGGRYYPKLVSAVPFTPATGPRLLVHPDCEAPVEARQCLLDGARALQEKLAASSLHVLFPTEAEHPALRQAGLVARKACQFHWHNQGYTNFEDFLGHFSSAKRKKARRERRRMTEAGLSFSRLAGNELNEAQWDAVFGFSARTFLLHGHRPYLSRRFFGEIARTMPDKLLVILAHFSGQPIAAAICFKSSDTLYGRYWGSLDDFHSLHFETCYYQGIEYCIEQGLKCYEPGTQGEHKISRGFTPTPTWSWHRIDDPAFQNAVARYVSREAVHVDAYMEHLREHLPYRHETTQA